MVGDIVQFKGVPTRLVYESGDGDFRIYGMKVDTNQYQDIKLNKYKNCTIKGQIPKLSTETEYDVVAQEEESKFGVCYKVTKITRDIPRTAQDIHNFLREVLTEKQADALYNAYPNIVDMIREGKTDEVDLSLVKGIGEKSFEKIKQKIVDAFCIMDLVIEFHGFLSMSVLRKLNKAYSSIDVLKERLAYKPYDSLCSIGGIGFKSADVILLGIEKASNKMVDDGKKPIINFRDNLISSYDRCLSCVLYLLQENENDGSTKCSLVELRKKVFQYVSECANHFNDAIKDSRIYFNKDTLEIALAKTREIEEYLASTIIKNIDNSTTKWDYDVEQYREVDGFSLSNTQMRAVRMLCEHNISILNGFSGSGKSSCTKAIMRLLDDNNKSCLLLSPTGKAARVLTEMTGKDAKTIHRGLGYNPSLGWEYGEDNKLFVDVVIVDELSMVDTFLFNRVIGAIDFNKTKLMMIGDYAQLPSIGAGRVLFDLVESNIIPMTTLTEIFRYSAGGLMKCATDCRNCIPYLDKSMKGKTNVFGDNKDYVFIDKQSEVIPEYTVSIYKKLLQKGYAVEDIQILSAKNVGDCGTVALNKLIQPIANKNYGSSNYIEYGDTKYYVGDLVVQKKNEYDAPVCDLNDNFSFGVTFVANGTTGVIKKILDKSVIIDFGHDIVEYPKEKLCNIRLAYAISVHSSQGSSIKAVILLTPSTHAWMESSNLLYVGMTRTKQICFHIGTLYTVNAAVKKKTEIKRNTFLQDLLKSNFTEERKEVVFDVDGYDEFGNSLPWD